jgi:CRISPR/Cas system-associated endoribonuclease Cas2
MQDDNKDFKDYIETLPPEIKQAIYSIDYPQKLQEIVKNNKLLIDQAGKLEAETTLIMAGIEPMDKYVNNLIKNVGLSSIQASIVAHDVNESIFKNIRESLKKINDQISEEDKVINEKIEPNKEDVIAGIENPANIKNNEESVSISSLKSNSINPETHESIDKGIEIRINNLPEIAPEAMLPITSSLASKPTEPFHQNISPVDNIVESKLTSTVAVPKENIIIEEKTKLPEKTKTSGDPYRESII